MRHETPMPIVQGAKSWNELLPQLWDVAADVPLTVGAEVFPDLGEPFPVFFKIQQTCLAWTFVLFDFSETSAFCQCET